MNKIAYLGLFGAALLNSCRMLSSGDVLSIYDVGFNLFVSRVSYDSTGNSQPDSSAPRKMALLRYSSPESREILVASQCGKVTAFGDIQNKASAVYLFECSDCLIWFDKNFQVLNFKAEPDIEEKLETNAKKLIIEIAKEESGWLLK